MDMILRAGAVMPPDAVVAWLRALRGRPYVPASGYDVGAVLRVDNVPGGPYYCAGVNVENADHALSVHGEGAALAAMLAALGPDARVAEAWVMAAPRGLSADSTDPRAQDGGTCCGRCRQHLWEFSADAATKIHTIAINGTVKTQTIGALLPGGFSFASFKDAAAAPAAFPADAAAARARLYRAAAPDHAAIYAWLRGLRGADGASAQTQAAVIVLDHGAAVAGVRMEDSAFTGLSAVQAAVANAVTLYGAIRIHHAFALTYGAALPDQALAPLPLSCLQVLREFGSSRLPLTLFTPGGAAWHSTVAAASSYAPTTARPYLTLRDGHLGA